MADTACAQHRLGYVPSAMRLKTVVYQNQSQDGNEELHQDSGGLLNEKSKDAMAVFKSLVKDLI